MTLKTGVPATLLLTGMVVLAPPPAMSKTLCCGAKLGVTFADAAPEVKLLIVLLWAMALATPVLWLRAERTGGQRLRRVLALLSGWRLGAPLLAAAGVGYLAMNFAVAVYAYPPVASYHAYAPGWAEMALVAWAGCLAGGLAALAHGRLASRLREGGEA